MKISEVVKCLSAELFVGYDRLDCDVLSACGSDLMSDVMAFSVNSCVLLTGLVNLQVIRTAEMMDIKAVVFVRGKIPTQPMIELASEKGIVLMSSRLPMFEACGRLYSNGLTGKQCI